MPKTTANVRSRHNHRGFWNSHNHVAPRDVYRRRLRCEFLEDRLLLAGEGPRVIAHATVAASVSR